MSETVRRTNEELINKERAASQHVRALELEKDDILHNYRQIVAENQRLQQSVAQVGEESKDNYA